MTEIKARNKERLWNKNYIYIMITNIIYFLSAYMLISTMPLFVKHIGGSTFEAGLMVTVFTFGGLLTRPIFGNLADKKGRKVTLYIGMILTLIPVFSYSFLSSITLLLLLRIIQGVGFAATTTATSTMGCDVTPEKKLSDGIGYLGASTSLAMAIGPALGLALVGHNEFSKTYIIASVFILISILVSLLVKYKYTPSNNAPSVEFRVREMYSLEKKAMPAAVIMFLTTCGYAGVSTFIAIYAKTKGIGDVGMFFTVYAAVLVLIRPFTNKVASKIGVSKVIIIGLFALMIGLFLIIVSTTLLGLIIAGIFYGIGYGALQPLLNTLAVSSVPNERRGIASATFLMSMDFGIGFGALIFGIVAQNFGFTIVYLIAIALAFIGFIYYIFRFRKIKPSNI